MSLGLRVGAGGGLEDYVRGEIRLCLGLRGQCKCSVQGLAREGEVLRYSIEKR